MFILTTIFLQICGFADCTYDRMHLSKCCFRHVFQSLSKHVIRRYPYLWSLESSILMINQHQQSVSQLDAPHPAIFVYLYWFVNVIGMDRVYPQDGQRWPLSCSVMLPNMSLQMAISTWKIHENMLRNLLEPGTTPFFLDSVFYICGFRSFRIFFLIV